MNLKTYDANKFTVISDKRFEALKAVAAAAEEYMNDAKRDWSGLLKIFEALAKLKETE